MSSRASYQLNKPNQQLRKSHCRSCTPPCFCTILAPSLEILEHVQEFLELFSSTLFVTEWMGLSLCYYQAARNTTTRINLTNYKNEAALLQFWLILIPMSWFETGSNAKCNPTGFCVKSFYSTTALGQPQNCNRTTTCNAPGTASAARSELDDVPRMAFLVHTKWRYEKRTAASVIGYITNRNVMIQSKAHLCFYALQKCKCRLS